MNSRRFIAVAAAGFLGLLPVLAATPASAADGSSNVQCSTGTSCQIQLENLISFKGDYNPGGHNMVVDIAPPPCLWEPIGDATTGSQAIIGEWGTDPAKAPTTFDINQSVAQANQLLATNPKPAGEWYELPINPAAGQAGAQECLKMPLYAWVPPGAAPPGINIPPQTLAQLALVKIRVPGKGRIILSPVPAKDTVNLPTFVRVTLAGRVHYANGMPYTRITATLGPVSATVWIKASPLQLSAPGGTVNANNCGYLGSAMLANDPAAVANTGVNGPIDCGVTYNQPGRWQLAATIDWQTCWVPAADNGPPPANCNAVPGAQLDPTQWAQAVNVKEIQANNTSGI